MRRRMDINLLRRSSRNKKAAKRKKDKYLEACRERWQDFIPMAYFVDGLAGKEARAAEKQLTYPSLASGIVPMYSEMACFVARLGCPYPLCDRSPCFCVAVGPRHGSAGPQPPDDSVAVRASVTSQRW
ncbi:hypothetical protein THAOC_13574 [Thalassiosira oceanica]|uniref:Uncharacterized protein n=1 Tax=Thalassiosira oceanica TaxID=159749 RepID=K0SX35_THAOC|nr:hypothetical protein THAOC_13574 [Thalassiosira oceanica]|eukprot:EJK65551.1 hypothetical protein THAOC_13574 [Thalassiosira oceanica]